jgi:hypothetical protein
MLNLNKFTIYKKYWIVIDIVKEDKDEGVVVKQPQPDDIE